MCSAALLCALCLRSGAAVMYYSNTVYSSNMFELNSHFVLPRLLSDLLVLPGLMSLVGRKQMPGQMNLSSSTQAVTAGQQMGL